MLGQSERQCVEMRSFHKRYDYMIKKLEEFIDLPGLVVVDCACGEGDGAIHFARLGCKVTGIDIDKKCIQTATNAFPEITFLTESILDMGLPTNFADIFICSETMEHLNPRQSKRAAEEIKRICKGKAYICITVPNNKKTCLAKKIHKQYLSSKDLQRHFREYSMVHKSIFYKNPLRKDRGNTVVIFQGGNHEN